MNVLTAFIASVPAVIAAVTAALIAWRAFLEARQAKVISQQTDVKADAIKIHASSMDASASASMVANSTAFHMAEELRKANTARIEAVQHQLTEFLKLTLSEGKVKAFTEGIEEGLRQAKAAADTANGGFPHADEPKGT